MKVRSATEKNRFRVVFFVVAKSTLFDQRRATDRGTVGYPV